jgi:hypothetical protein
MSWRQQTSARKLENLLLLNNPHHSPLPQGEGRCEDLLINKSNINNELMEKI